MKLAFLATLRLDKRRKLNETPKTMCACVSIVRLKKPHFSIINSFGVGDQNITNPRGSRLTAARGWRAFVRGIELVDAIKSFYLKSDLKKPPYCVCYSYFLSTSVFEFFFFHFTARQTRLTHHAIQGSDGVGTSTGTTRFFRCYEAPL